MTRHIRRLCTRWRSRPVPLRLRPLPPSSSASPSFLRGAAPQAVRAGVAVETGCNAVSPAARTDQDRGLGHRYLAETGTETPGQTLDEAPPYTVQLPPPVGGPPTTIGTKPASRGASPDAMVVHRAAGTSASAGHCSGACRGRSHDPSPRQRTGSAQSEMTGTTRPQGLSLWLLLIVGGMSTSRGKTCFFVTLQPTEGCHPQPNRLRVQTGEAPPRHPQACTRLALPSIRYASPSGRGRPPRPRRRRAGEGLQPRTQDGPGRPSPQPSPEGRGRVAFAR